MTVFVDHYSDWLKVPKKWEGGGHLFGTSLDELHGFAKRIGLKREWYQGGDDHFPHYDLTRNKRRQAIEAGATVVEPGVIPDKVIRHDPN